MADAAAAAGSLALLFSVLANVDLVKVAGERATVAAPAVVPGLDFSVVVVAAAVDLSFCAFFNDLSTMIFGLPLTGDDDVEFDFGASGVEEVDDLDAPWGEVDAEGCSLAVAVESLLLLTAFLFTSDVSRSLTTIFSLVLSDFSVKSSFSCSESDFSCSEDTTNIYVNSFLGASYLFQRFFLSHDKENQIIYMYNYNKIIYRYYEA